MRICLLSQWQVSLLHDQLCQTNKDNEQNHGLGPLTKITRESAAARSLPGNAS